MSDHSGFALRQPTLGPKHRTDVDRTPAHADLLSGLWTLVHPRRCLVRGRWCDITTTGRRGSTVSIGRRDSASASATEGTCVHWWTLWERRIRPPASPIAATLSLMGIRTVHERLAASRRTLPRGKCDLWITARLQQRKYHDPRKVRRCRTIRSPRYPSRFRSPSPHTPISDTSPLGVRVHRGRLVAGRAWNAGVARHARPRGGNVPNGQPSRPCVAKE